jgi:hypothetical protein
MLNLTWQKDRIHSISSFSFKLEQFSRDLSFYQVSQSKRDNLPKTINASNSNPQRASSPGWLKKWIPTISRPPAPTWPNFALAIQFFAAPSALEQSLEPLLLDIALGVEVSFKEFTQPSFRLPQRRLLHRNRLSDVQEPRRLRHSYCDRRHGSAPKQHDGIEFVDQRADQRFVQWM